MKTVDMIRATVGQTLTIKTTPNDQVLGYRIFVDRWKGTPKTLTNWPGTEAESGNGVSFDLSPADGYDITIKASVKQNAAPAIGVDIALDEAAPMSYNVAFPSEEGPVVTRDWNIFF